MNHRVVAVLFAAGLLSGCTDADWDHALSYTGLSKADPAQPAPKAEVAATVPAAPAADTWCVEVAKSTQTEAALDGFDGQTQQRRALAAFKQCSRYQAQ